MNTSRIYEIIRCTSKGQGMVEYALIIFMIALALVSALRALVVPMNNLFSSISW